MSHKNHRTSTPGCQYAMGKSAGVHTKGALQDAMRTNLFLFRSSRAGDARRSFEPRLRSLDGDRRLHKAALAGMRKLASGVARLREATV